MDRLEMRKKIVVALQAIAPEIEDAEIVDTENLQEQFFLDSVDYLNYVVKLEQDFGVSISEKDYRQLTTINGAIEYLSSK